MSEPHVEHKRPIKGTDVTVTFKAENIRRERTGIHATLYILVNTAIAAWSNFNIEKAPDRVRFVGSAHKQFGTNLQSAYPRENLQHEIDLFAQTIWPEFIKGYQAEAVEGDPTGEPIAMLAGPHIIKGGGTILFAPPGLGKSWTGLLITVAIDSGTNGIWAVEKPTKSIYINLERGAASIRRRLGQVNGALGLAPNRSLIVLNARGRSLSDIYESASRVIDEQGIEFGMLDSVSRTGFGDLNENKDVNRVMDALNKLVPTWGALAHTPRSDDSHVYGGIHFDAAADIMIRLASQRDETQLGIQLQCTKANDIRLPPPMTLAYTFDDYGLLDVRKAGLDEFAELADDFVKTLPLAQQMVAFLKRNGATDLVEVANELNVKLQVARVTASRRKDLFIRLEKGVYGVKAAPEHSD